MFWTALLLGGTLALQPPQPPEGNPCQVAVSTTPSINPDVIYFANEALSDPSWANQATVTIHEEVKPATATSPATVLAEPSETITITVTLAENSTPWTNCWKLRYTPGPRMKRDGTRYYARTVVAHATGLRGPQGNLSNPFVLTPPQKSIPVTETRVGRASL
jgi:hypothetical protein